MNNQRLISDARREAKRLARISGRPHQHHLDDLAARAGLKDWEAFLADPSPIPPERGQTIDEGNHDVEAAAPAVGAAVSSLPHHLGRRYGLIIGALMAAMGLLIAHFISVTNRLEGTTVETSYALAMMETDRVKSTTLRSPHLDRDMPVSSLRRTDRGLEMSVMVADERWKTYEERRSDPLRWYPAGSAAMTSSINHPVLRIAGDVDCHAGTFMPNRSETADDYRGPTRLSQSFTPRLPIWKMTAFDAARICSTPGHGDITSAISRT